MKYNQPDFISMDIVILTIGFHPNTGGLETHLTDLTRELSKKYKILVVTLSPITTNVKAKRIEKNGKITIWRIPWYGGGLFYKLLSYPLLEFLYLVPPLFGGLLLGLIKYPEIKIVHAQGLSGIVPGGILGKIFGKRIIASTHFVYHFGDNFFSKFSRWAYNFADRVLCVSLESAREMKKVGIATEKIGKCAYWIDLAYFKPQLKDKAKKEINWEKGKFSVMFVGRLVKEKGIIELLNSVGFLKKGIQLYIVGDGPLRKEVELASKNKNLTYLGRIDNDQLPVYYSAADIVVVPSYEETLGRVAMEALACGTVVVGTDKGGMREVVSEEVGLLIGLSPKNIAKAINKLFFDKKLYKNLRSNARVHMRKLYSPKNVDTFIKEYGFK